MLGKAVRAFDCHPAGVRDPNAGNLDLPPAHPHGLAVRRGEALLDQGGYHIDVEPMADQRRPGAAAQSCVGEHFERAALLSAEMTPHHTNAPQRQNVLADRICHLVVCANRAAPIRNNTLKISWACDFHAAPLIKRGLVRTRCGVAVASPARTRLASRFTVKPCAIMERVGARALSGIGEDLERAALFRAEALRHQIVSLRFIAGAADALPLPNCDQLSRVRDIKQLRRCFDRRVGVRRLDGAKQPGRHVARPIDVPRHRICGHHTWSLSHAIVAVQLPKGGTLRYFS
jgi:hypothetical protein